METKDLDRFGKIIRGWVCSHRDDQTDRLVVNPIWWLAHKMGKSNATVKDYLRNPSLMNQDIRASMVRVIRENLIFEADSIDVIIDLIDSIPERKS